LSYEQEMALFEELTGRKADQETSRLDAKQRNALLNDHIGRLQRETATAVAEINRLIDVNTRTAKKILEEEVQRRGQPFLGLRLGGRGGAQETAMDHVD